MMALFLVVLVFLMLTNIALVPVGVWLLALCSRARDREVTTCQRCGYDVRASPLQCPECGLLRRRWNRGSPSALQRLLGGLGAVLVGVPLGCDVAAIVLLIVTGFRLLTS